LVSTFHPINLLTIYFLFSIAPPPPIPTLFPYTTLFRSRSWDVRVSSRRTNCCCGPDIPRGLLHTAPATGTKHASPSEYRVRNSRSEEHTSELQSPDHLVCRLLLEKKKTIHKQQHQHNAI